MVAWIWRIMIVVMILVSVNDSEARRDVLSSEQKGELAKIQRLLVEVIAITDQGPADPGALTETVSGECKYSAIPWSPIRSSRMMRCSG